MEEGDGEGTDFGAGVELDAEGGLTILFEGERFDGGQLPVDALRTIEKMNAAVAAIAKDLDVAQRDDAHRASKYSKVELVLFGEIEDGSARLRAKIVPVFLAALSSAAAPQQAALLQDLSVAVPAVVQAVHQGRNLTYPVSGKTLGIVAGIGQRLGTDEQLVLAPPNSDALREAVDDRAATVTFSSTNTARQVHEATETRSFFVTGSVRRIENQADGTGKITLATSSGLYTVPSSDGRLVETAAQWLSKNRGVVLAIAGRGEFDGEGRLKTLTHLTDMEPIDRALNLDSRLSELLAASDDPTFGEQIERARPTIQRAVLATGRAPGLFIDEDDHLEARWLVHPEPDSPAQVVNVSFGSSIEIYVFDRSIGEITREATFGPDDMSPGDLIADIITTTAGGRDA